MASITKLNNGYKATVSYNLDGKSKRGFKTKSEARDWALEEELYLKNN